MTLDIQTLFTPDASGVNPDPNVPIPDGTWMANLLETAQTLGLDTTAWQPGGPERTIMAIDAVAESQRDVAISIMAQGGLLDFAASGTVTYTGLNGVTTVVPVTPDPSIPSQNPTGALGWLDALGQSFFRTSRLLATAAAGTLSIVNKGVTTITYGIGLYHVANATSGATYSNTAALSLPPSSIGGTGGVVTGISGTVNPTVSTNAAHGLAIGDVVFIEGVVGVDGINGTFSQITNVPSSTSFIISRTVSGAWTSGGTVYKCTQLAMAADAIGLGGNASPGDVSAPITQNVGVSVSNLTAWGASNFESNTAYANRCRLSFGALSPNGPSAAYEYFALSAQALLAAEVPAISMRSGAIVKAITYVNPVTEVVTTVVASATPASSTLGGTVTPGCAQLAVASASNASPILIGSAAHGLVTGDAVTISGVLGNTAANGTFTVTVTNSTHFQLDGSTGNGTYTGGGVIEGGDLGQVDRLIQENVVNDGTTAQTISSLAFPVAVVATVVVPQAFVAAYTVAAPKALQALFDTFPIGGDIPVGGGAGTVPISAVEGALFDAGVLVLGAASYVRSVPTLTINGGTTDLTYPSPDHYGILSAPSIQVIGV